MDSLKDRVLDATKRFNKESLRPILTSTDLGTLQESGLSIVEILEAENQCNDQRLAESCLTAGVALSKQMDNSAKVLDALFAKMARAAARWDKIDILEYCLDQGAEPSTHLGGAAAFYGRERSFQLLMLRGLDINANYGYAGDALCSAALGNKINMVNFLIENGAHLDSKFMFSRLYGPLACAAMCGSTNMLELLISKGMAIDGSLALHQAVTFGRTDIMEYLITAGADVNEIPQDEDSYTGADFWPGRPLHFAAEYRKLQAVNFLLEHGADPTQLNSRDQTELEVSVRDGEPWKEFEDLLRERGFSAK